MPSIPKKDRLLRIAAIALGLMAFLSGIWAYQLWDNYYDYLPRSANPGTGNIYSLNIYGRVVYQTLKEQARLEKRESWSTGVFCAVAALAGISQWRARKRTPGN